MQRLHQGIIQTADECRRQRIPKPKTIRSPKYLNWIRRQPCLVQPCRGKSQAAHTGRGGKGIKASDLDTIPLCEDHHMLDPNSYHRIGERAFCRFWGVDIGAAIKNLRRRFESMAGKTTTLLVMALLLAGCGE